MLSGKFQNRDIPCLKARLLPHIRSRGRILVQDSLNSHTTSGGTKLVYLDPMTGMVARYPATPGGEEMIHGCLSSPERQVLITKKFAATEEVK